MKLHTKTLLEEITGIVPERDLAQVIETRGCHLIASALNLLESINQKYGQEISEEMERRLINGIKAKNSIKFARGAKKLNNSGDVDEN